MGENACNTSVTGSNGLVQGTVFYTLKSRQVFRIDPVSAVA